MAGPILGLGSKGGSFGLGFNGGSTHLLAISLVCSKNQVLKILGKLLSTLSKVILSNG